MCVVCVGARTVKKTVSHAQKAAHIAHTHAHTQHTHTERTHMASNNPPTQPNEEEVIIRWSGKWFQYLFARLGLLRSFVNMIEDALSIGGRFFLLGYILYTAAKSILLLSDPNLVIPF